jgi:hypothetical protein
MRLLSAATPPPQTFQPPQADFVRIVKVPTQKQGAADRRLPRSLFPN